MCYLGVYKEEVLILNVLSVSVNPCFASFGDNSNISRNTVSSFPAVKTVNKKQESVLKGKEPLNSNEKKYLLIAGLTALSVASVATIAICKKRAVNINNKKTEEKIKEIIVTGSENVKNTVSNLKAEDYDASKIFKANLHIHSTMSDGKLTPLEILNQALDCSKKLPDDEKFIFSLTDHDSIEGVKEIAKEISKDPDKYQKLKFIPGIELSTKHHNINLSKKPVELDFLIYGFDINDPKISAETERRKKAISGATANFLNLINQEQPNANLTIEKINECNSPLVKNLCSNGYVKALKESVKNILCENFCENSVNEKLIKAFGDERYAYNANISITEAVKLAKDTNSFPSLAHPGKFNLDHAALTDRYTKLVDDIFNTFFDNGGNSIEYNYMSYNPQKSWWPEVSLRLNNLKSGFLKTGGYDTHGLSIMSK